MSSRLFLCPPLGCSAVCKPAFFKRTIEVLIFDFDFILMAAISG